MSRVKLLAFDWGHTLMDERRTGASLDAAAVHLMPDVLDVLPRLTLPLAVWANTRTAREADVRRYLSRANIERFFTWVVTSVDAGARKPAPEFFAHALAHCGATKEHVLFVGNQLDTDVRGGMQHGIRTVWLSGAAYRSDDDDARDPVAPSFTIERLGELPALLRRIEAATSV